MNDAASLQSSKRKEHNLVIADAHIGIRSSGGQLRRQDQPLVVPFILFLQNGLSAFSVMLKSILPLSRGTVAYRLASIEGGGAAGEQGPSDARSVLAQPGAPVWSALRHGRRGQRGLALQWSAECS